MNIDEVLKKLDGDFIDLKKLKTRYNFFIKEY